MAYGFCMSTFASGSKYPIENIEAGALLRELALPMPTVARLIGVPLNTCKAIASKAGWRKDAEHKAEAKRLQAYRLGSGAIPVARGNRCLLGASRFLRLEGEGIALVSPDDHKRIVKVFEGDEPHKSLILKELGWWDLRSSGEDVEAEVDSLQRAILTNVSATDITPSKSTTSDDPKKIAREHAEQAGRNALRFASEAPPPIKTWRDLEIAAKLAGVATSEGVKDQPLINIAMLNDPTRFGKPLSQKPVRQADDETLQDVEAQELTAEESLACEANT